VRCLCVSSMPCVCVCAYESIHDMCVACVCRRCRVCACVRMRPSVVCVCVRLLCVRACGRVCLCAMFVHDICVLVCLWCVRACVRVSVYDVCVLVCVFFYNVYVCVSVCVSVCPSMTCACSWVPQSKADANSLAVSANTHTGTKACTRTNLCKTHIEAHMKTG